MFKWWLRLRHRLGRHPLLRPIDAPRHAPDMTDAEYLRLVRAQRHERHASMRQDGPQ